MFQSNSGKMELGIKRKIGYDCMYENEYDGQII